MKLLMRWQELPSHLFKQIRHQLVQSVICKRKPPHVATTSEYYNMQRTGKVYQTKIWKFATNPTSTDEKLLDNAGLEFVLSTDTVEGKDDYLNGHHLLFEWCYCNYKRYDDGTAYPVATEFDKKAENIKQVNNIILKYE